VTAFTDRAVVAGEVDEFNVALPKMHGALHRVQGGGGDSVVAVRDHGTLQVGHISIRYPMAGTVDIDDSRPDQPYFDETWRPGDLTKLT
jgi:hypothetical protein